MITGTTVWKTSWRLRPFIDPIATDMKLVVREERICEKREKNPTPEISVL